MNFLTIAFVFLTSTVFKASLKDEIDFAVDCGADLLTWTLISCELPDLIIGKGYKLHAIPLKGNKEDGEKMEVVENDKRAAWCTFPKTEDETPPFVKGKYILLHFQIRDLYVLALTNGSDAIIGRDFIEVRYNLPCGLKIEPVPYTDVGYGARVDIKLDFDGCDVERKVSWDMSRSFFLFEDERNCFNKALIGQFDMPAFMSLDSYIPVETQQVGYLLPIPVFARPFGLVFFTATIRMANGTHVLTTFLTSKPDRDMMIQNDLKIIFEPFPNADLVWFEDRNLTLDASRTYSRQLTLVSGFVGDSTLFIRFKWKCEGGLACDSFPPEDRYGPSKVTVSGTAMKGRNPPFKVTLKVDLFGQDFKTLLTSSTEIKTIRVMSKEWPPIELRCVFNCYGPVMKNRARLVRFHCPDCLREIDQYSVSWLGCNGGICTQDVLYYELPPRQALVYLEVTNVQGNKIKIGHKYKLIERNNVFEMYKAIANVAWSDNKVLWYDVKRGIEEVNHPLLYSNVAEFDDDALPVIWSITFNQRVLNLPGGLKGPGRVRSYMPRFYMTYIWPDGTIPDFKGREWMEEDILLKDPNFKNDDLKTIWESILDDWPYTHSPMGLVYLYANFLKSGVPDKEPKVYENLMTFLNERTLKFSETLILWPMLRDQVKPEVTKVTENLLCERATRSIRISVSADGTILSLSDCFAIASLEIVSEMLNGWYKANGKEKLSDKTVAKFYDSVSKISKYHGNVYYNGKTCQGSNWYMNWVTESFNSSTIYKCDAPEEDFDGYLRSVEFDWRSLRKFIQKSVPAPVDYETYLAIYVITRPSYEIEDESDLPKESIFIEHYGRWNNKLLTFYGERNAMKLILHFPFNEISRDSFQIKGNLTRMKIESECLVMKIRAGTEVPDLLVLYFPKNYEFAVSHTMAKNLREQFQFILKEDHKWKKYEGTTSITLLPQRKALMFSYPTSNHMFIIRAVKSIVRGYKPLTLDIDYTLLNVHCVYWSKRSQKWDFDKCTTVKYGPLEGDVECLCKKALGSFSSLVKDKTHSVDVDVKKSLTKTKLEGDGLFMCFLVISLWLLYVALLIYAKRKDIQYKGLYQTNMVLHHFNPFDSYRYLICVQISPIPDYDINCRAFLIVVGSLTTTGKMTLETPRYFKRGSESWFMVSSARELGRINGCMLELEYPDDKTISRLTKIDVYDIANEEMYALPLEEKTTMTKSVWSYHNPDQLNSHEDSGLYIKNWFINCINQGHLLLNILFPVPGAQRMVYDATRLHCIILTSLLVAYIHLFSWNNQRQNGEETGSSILYLILLSPLVLLAYIILYFMLVMCNPEITYGPNWNKLLIPSTFRVCGNRPSLEKIIPTGILKNPPYSKETIPPSYHHLGSSESLGTITQRNNHNNSSSREIRDPDSTYSDVESNIMPYDSDSFERSKGFTVSFIEPRFSSSYESESSDEVEKSKKKKKRVLKRLKWDKNLHETPQKSSLCFGVMFNMMVALVVGYMLFLSWYLISVGFYMQDMVVLNTAVNAIIILCINFLILVPLLILLIAIGLAVKNRKSYCRVWAKKRSELAEKMAHFWKQMEEFNFRERVMAFQPYEYKSKRDAYHTLFNMSFYRDKLAASKLGPVKGSKQEVIRKGGPGLILFIIVFFVITNNHTKVNECFNQKTFIYNLFGKPQFDREYIKTTVSVDGVWASIVYTLRNHFVYKNAMEAGVLEMGIESFAIRQLRVRPHTEHCLLRSSLKSLLFPRKRCQYELNNQNEETRNFIDSWMTHVNDGDDDDDDNPPDRGMIGNAYTYRRPDRMKELYSGNIGGYYFTPRKGMDEDAFDSLELLKNSSWIDENTRYIILEFTIFNINNGIASALQFIYEFRPNGIFWLSTCHSFPLTFRQGEYIFLIMALVLLAILALQIFVKEALLMVQIGKDTYWRSIDNVTEIISAINSVFLLLIFGYRFYITSVKMESLASTLFGSDKIEFITLQDISAIVYIVDVMSAFMSFVVLFRILKMARHIKRLNVMLLLFYDVFGLFLSPMIAIFGASIGLLVQFNSVLFYFQNLYRSMSTSMQFIISPLKIHREIRYSSSLMGPILIIIQWVMFVLIIVNAFVVAINENYSVKSHELEDTDQQNTLEAMNELMLNIIGVETAGPSRKKTIEEEEKKNDDDFNVDKLLNSTTS